MLPTTSKMIFRRILGTPGQLIIGLFEFELALILILALASMQISDIFLGYILHLVESLSFFVKL